MSLPRFTVSGLLKSSVVFALGLAALRSESVVGYGLTLVATLATILATILGAVFSRGRDRAFWAGFASFGGLLLLLLFPYLVGGFVHYRLGSAFRELGRPMGRWVHDVLLPRRKFPIWRSEILERIIFLELCLIFALAGGFVVRGFALRAETGTQSDRRSGERPDP